MIELLTGNLLSYIIAGGAALLALVGAYFKGAANAKAKARAMQAEATVEAVQRASDGAAEAVTQIKAGKSPQEVKDANDAAWR